MKRAALLLLEIRSSFLLVLRIESHEDLESLPYFYHHQIHAGISIDERFIISRCNPGYGFPSLFGCVFFPGEDRGVVLFLPKDTVDSRQTHAILSVMRTWIQIALAGLFLLLCVGCAGEGESESPLQSDGADTGVQLPSTYVPTNSYEGGVPAPAVDGTSRQVSGSQEDSSINEEAESELDAEGSGGEGPGGESSVTPDVQDPTDCYPECFAKQCGEDGCGGSCGNCPAGTLCAENLCESDPTCTPNCAGKECGGDGCGGSCGDCPAGSSCEGGQCDSGPICTPNCAGKACGDDGCGGVCGDCTPSSECTNGQCICQSNCTGKICGDDGCGGTCGDCGEGLSCVGGQCICLPDCEGKTCGDDGCGGSCGVCGCGDQKLFVRAANLGESSSLQVFFITAESDIWNEFKSKTVIFDTGGEYETLELAMGEHPEWNGTITGIRIDPINGNEPFGIDDVCVGFTEEDCLLQWTFNGASEVVSPFFDWELLGIEDMWTDGERWGGQGDLGDPLLRISLDFECEP